ncbi:MAG: hypothetical protein HN348_26655, partial [Proteobacteria bacterium]|nr:hypothetical protein [Pseudomonadota bacterium]
MSTMFCTALLLIQLAAAAPLNQTVGRTEVRLRSAPFVPLVGATLDDLSMLDRLEHLGYTQVSDRPDEPGEYQISADRVWIYRQAHQLRGRQRKAKLFALVVDEETVVGAELENGKSALLNGKKGL